jgi:hypothetical protein
MSDGPGSGAKKESAVRPPAGSVAARRWPLRGVLFVCGLLAALLLVGPLQATADSNHRAGAAQVRLATQDTEHPLQVRPRMISYTGDGTGYLAGHSSSPGNIEHGGLHWRSWKQRSGFALGYAWINNCRPSCAGGRFSKHRATVRVRRPRHRIFTRMTIRYRYGSRHYVDHRALRHIPASSYYPGYYEWTICGNRYTGPC